MRATTSCCTTPTSGPSWRRTRPGPEWLGWADGTAPVGAGASDCGVHREENQIPHQSEANGGLADSPAL